MTSPPRRLSPRSLKTLVRDTLARKTLARDTLASEAGSTLIEVGIGLPVFLLLTFAFIEFTMVVFGIGNMGFACRSATRYAALHSLTSYAPTTQQDLNNIVAPYIFRFPANTYTVNFSYINSWGGASNNVVGNGVLLTVAINYTFGIPGFYNVGTLTYHLPFSTTAFSPVLQ